MTNRKKKIVIFVMFDSRVNFFFEIFFYVLIKENLDVSFLLGM